ncbi:MAG TPA: tryptophan-rich sensory protein [Methanothrix sp.]|nr:tryptophan-rich sensory protein [Methanothrix sp.]
MKIISYGEFPRLILCIAVCQMAGIVGSIFTAESVTTWYITLEKPGFAPPGWVISAVWISLYTLMGVSLFLIWRQDWGSDREKEGNKRIAIAAFALQLLVNAAWSWAFFGLQSPPAGFATIIILWLLILFTARLFWPISRPAAWLLLPYILWVSFAAFLNFSLWRLNP